MIQVIKYNNRNNVSDNNIVFNDFGCYESFDLYDINIISLNDSNIWHSHSSQITNIDCKNDLCKIIKSIKTCKKSKVLVLFPKNYTFYYNYSTYSKKYEDYTEIKTICDVIQKMRALYVHPSFPKFEYEKGSYKSLDYLGDLKEIVKIENNCHSYCTINEEYLKYYKIDVILTDNERGYKIETTTWEEKIESLIPLFTEIYGEDGNDYDVESIIEWIKHKQKNNIDDVDSRIRWIIRNYPGSEYFYFHDIEDLFVWNDLCHLFDLEHHHKSVLTNGEEVEWYWTYTNDSEQREDGLWYRKEVGYKKIRVPVDAKIGSVTTWIPDEAIIKYLY